MPGALIGFAFKDEVQFPMPPFDGPEFILDLEKKALTD